MALKSSSCKRNPNTKLPASRNSHRFSLNFASVFQRTPTGRSCFPAKTTISLTSANKTSIGCTSKKRLFLPSNSFTPPTYAGEHRHKLPPVQNGPPVLSLPSDVYVHAGPSLARSLGACPGGESSRVVVWENGLGMFWKKVVICLSSFGIFKRVMKIRAFLERFLELFEYIRGWW